MELSQFVMVIITVILSAGSFIIAYLQAKEKGAVFSNSYLFASKTEREKMDKKAEYKLARNIFAGLGALFLLETLHIILLWAWLFYAVVIIAILLIIYAIIATVKSRL